MSCKNFKKWLDLDELCIDTTHIQAMVFKPTTLSDLILNWVLLLLFGFFVRLYKNTNTAKGVVDGHHSTLVMICTLVLVMLHRF